MPPAKRSTEEIITLALCALCIMGLSLFSAIRFIRGDIAIAIIDLIGLLGTSFIFWHTWRTQDIRQTGPVLSMLALTGSIAILGIGGPDERYLLYPNVVIAFFLATPVVALTLCTLSLAAASYILLPALEIFEYSKFLLSISGCILFAYIFARERNIQRDNLLNLSTRDALTGAGNRRAFDDRLEETVRMQQRTPGDSSMMLIDLDNFKQINDTEGHAIGDEVLILVADIVHGRLRAGDSLYRYGGDEFVVLAATEVTSAMKLAEELRYLVEAATPPGKIAPTLSIGVAQHLPDEPGSDWVKRADDALFEAKRSGRNRVEIGTSVRLAG